MQPNVNHRSLHFSFIASYLLQLLSPLIALRSSKSVNPNKHNQVNCFATEYAAGSARVDVNATLSTVLE